MGGGGVLVVRGAGTRTHTGVALECQPLVSSPFGKPVGPMVGRMSVNPGRDGVVYDK